MVTTQTLQRRRRHQGMGGWAAPGANRKAVGALRRAPCAAVAECGPNAARRERGGLQAVRPPCSPELDLAPSQEAELRVHQALSCHVGLAGLGRQAHVLQHLAPMHQPDALASVTQLLEHPVGAGAVLRRPGEGRGVGGQRAAALRGGSPPAAPIPTACAGPVRWPPQSLNPKARAPGLQGRAGGSRGSPRTLPAPRCAAAGGRWVG